MQQQALQQHNGHAPPSLRQAGRASHTLSGAASTRDLVQRTAAPRRQGCAVQPAAPGPSQAAPHPLQAAGLGTHQQRWQQQDVAAADRRRMRSSERGCVPAPAAQLAGGATFRSSRGQTTQHPQQQQQEQQRQQQRPQQQQEQQQQQRQQQRHRHHHQQAQLQLAGKQDSSGRPKPEAPAASGAPPSSSEAGSALSPGKPTTSNGSSSEGSSSSSRGSSSSDASLADEAEAAVDRFLEQRWAEIKRDIKRDLPPEQAAMVDRWSAEDLSSDKVFRQMAETQLGPFLQVMGISDDPYEFFMDLFRYALAFQLAGAGLTFYTVELALGGDAGDALRAVAGLLLGYFLRLGIKIEQLAWPIYNALVQWLIQDNAVYDYPPATPQQRQDTVNRLAVSVAAAFLVPKFAFGWSNQECWQIVVPMVAGLVFFDAAYLFGLLAKLTLRGDGGGDEDDGDGGSGGSGRT